MSLGLESLDQVCSAFQNDKAQEQQVVSKINYCLMASGVMLFIVCVVCSLPVACEQGL